MLTTAMIDENFLSLMQIPLLAGRNIAPIAPGEEEQIAVVEVLINETAMQALRKESPENTLGQTLFDGRYEIVGIIPDFNFSSLHNKVQPLMLMQNERGEASRIALKIAGGQIPGTLSSIERAWKQTGTTPAFRIQLPR